MRFLSPPEVRQLADAMPERYGLPVLVAAYCGPASRQALGAAAEGR
jgi:hypothetical protein